MGSHGMWVPKEVAEVEFIHRLAGQRGILDSAQVMRDNLTGGFGFRHFAGTCRTIQYLIIDSAFFEVTPSAIEIVYTHSNAIDYYILLWILIYHKALMDPSVFFGFAGTSMWLPRRTSP